MPNSKIEKNSYQGIALIIAVSFAIGFVIATISAMTIFCPECFGISDPEKNKESMGFFPDDDRIIIKNVIDIPTIVEEIFTEIGKEKRDYLLQMVSKPIIQLALKNSNERDSKMTDDIRIQFYLQREKEWTKAQEDTPFTESIINNDVSRFLLNKHVIQSVKFDYLYFGEHILTNVYGANVAVSIKTDNYDQSKDDWWQIAMRNQELITFARDCEFDSSAGIFSEDIIVKIKDKETGQVIGMLNSATPCNVTKDSVERKTQTQIIPVSLDNITTKGKIKILYLQDLVKNPIIQNSLKLSNEEFRGFNDKSLLKLKEETDWPKPGMGEPNSLQISILENKVSVLLRQHLNVSSVDNDNLQFPEIILTNAKGVNVANTELTFNYIQNDDEWWQVASQNPVLVRHCGKDLSINMISEDIIIQIYDNKGKFIGILNAATPCDVVLVKPPNFYGDSN